MLGSVRRHGAALGRRAAALALVAALSRVARAVRVSKQDVAAALAAPVHVFSGGHDFVLDREGDADGELLEDILEHVLDHTHFHYQVAARSDPSTVTIWGADGSNHSMSHDSEIDDVRFLPGGDKALTIGMDPVAVIWDTATGARTQELPHSGPVGCGDVFPDGERVVTCAGEAKRIIWNVTSGERLHVLSPPEHHPNDSRFGFLQRSVSVFPTGDRVLVWGSEEWATIWNASSGKAICELSAHAAPISSIAFFPGGDRVVTGGLDRRAFIWNASTCEVLHKLVDAAWMLEVAVVSGGDKVVTMSSNGRVAVWDAATGKRLHELVSKKLVGGGLASGFHAFPSGDRVVTFASREAVIWNAATGEVMKRLRGLDSVYSAAVSPNGYLLALCGTSEVSVWDLASGAKLQRHRTVAVPRPPNVCPVDIGMATNHHADHIGHGLTWRSVH